MEELKYQDKVLIAKAIADITTDIYKDNKNYILNYVTKNGTYESNFGEFYIKHNSSKTVQEIIDKKYAEIEKLQKEIATLSTITDKTTIVTEASTTLMSKHTQIADMQAVDMIQSIYTELASKRLEKSASKRHIG